VVVAANQDGTGLQELGDWVYTGHIDFHQCWSSVGNRFVFIDGARQDPVRWLSVVDSDGDGRRRLVEVTDIRGLSISPDGGTVLMAQQEQRVIEIPHEGHIDLETRYPVNIFSVVVESGEVKRFTDFVDIQAESPVFSPDLSKIAFIGRTDDPQTHFDIYVMNADGSGLLRLTHNHGFVSFYQGLQWSPDSTKILYGLETLMLSDIDHYDDAFVLDVASGQSTNLTNTPEIDDAYFSWSPDGNKIAFMSTRELRPGISDTGVFVMGAAGENVTEVPALGGRPAWLPDSRTLIATGRAEDGTLAVVIASVEHGESQTLFPYASISDKYSFIADLVWLGR
jgi:Tol biopolymer transport system component